MIFCRLLEYSISVGVWGGVSGLLCFNLVMKKLILKLGNCIMLISPERITLPTLLIRF